MLKENIIKVLSDIEIFSKIDNKILASYLGIKPETLSRILKKLKSDGEITIKKN